MGYRSTREVARLLGINPSRLARAIWTGRLTSPAKSPEGSFLWTMEDMNRASWQLLGRPVDQVPGDAQTPNAQEVANG